MEEEEVEEEKDEDAELYLLPKFANISVPLVTDHLLKAWVSLKKK